jgi:chloride channel protein, CIC family
VRAALTRLPVPEWATPAVGGLLMGLVASTAAFAAARTFDFGVTGLGLVGSGYGMLQAVFSHASWMPTGFEGFAFFVFIAALKILCTSFTVGSGGSAGDFAPSLVIGGLSGAALAVGVGAVFPQLDVDPAAFALVGMAALFGGAAHVPLAALVLVSEMAGSYALLVPTMLALGVTSILLRRRTLYDAQRSSPHRARTMPPSADVSGSFEAPRPSGGA